MELIIQFFKNHPYWAVFLTIFMVLPMLGAVVHVILKALGHGGVDGTKPEETDSSQS